MICGESRFMYVARRRVEKFMIHQIARWIARLVGFLWLWASPAAAQIGADFGDCIGTDTTVVLTEVRQIGPSAFAHIRLRTIAGPTPKRRIIEYSDYSHKGEQWILLLDPKGQPLTDVDDGCVFRTRVIRGSVSVRGTSAIEPLEVFARRIGRERARHDRILMGTCTPKGRWLCPGVPKDQRTERELGAIVQELLQILPRIVVRCGAASVPSEVSIDIHPDGHASIDPGSWGVDAKNSGDSVTACIDLALRGLRFRVLDEDAVSDSVTVPLQRKE